MGKTLRFPNGAAFAAYLLAPTRLERVRIALARQLVRGIGEVTPRRPPVTQTWPGVVTTPFPIQTVSFSTSGQPVTWVYNRAAHN